MAENWISKVVQFYPEQIRELEKIKRDTGATSNWQIRKAVDEYIKKRNGK